MQIFFNHPLMYVIDYPTEDIVEMCDKRAGRVGVMRGAMAERFRRELGTFLAEERDDEQFEDFIDAYRAVVREPVSKH